MWGPMRDAGVSAASWCIPGLKNNTMLVTVCTCVCIETKAKKGPSHAEHNRRECLYSETLLLTMSERVRLLTIKNNRDKSNTHLIG